MSRGGVYGGQKGFPYVECDAQGLKAVVVKFSSAKNAYREMVPMCLSNANAAFVRLEQLLRSKYKELGRSNISFDDYFVRSARLMAAREKLNVALGKKPIGSLDIVSPFTVFTDGQRAIILQSKVESWAFYTHVPNISHIMCETDEGWQAQTEIRYVSMKEWLLENGQKRETSDKENAERNKRDANSL